MLYFIIIIIIIIIQLHVLIKKLLNLGVNSDLILWIRPFLSDRPQRVRLNGQLGRDPIMSDEIIVNSGAPRDAFYHLFYFLYILTLLTLIKYADDMALVACLKADYSLSQYFLQIDSLNCQFTSSFLKLNITKTKELVFGKGKAGNTNHRKYTDAYLYR